MVSKMKNPTKLREALELFLKEEGAFTEAIISSTNAGFAVSGYGVELYPDGTHRVLWTKQVGNLYEPTGVILNVPRLSDEDYCDLCKIAGDDTSDENLAEELKMWIEATMAIAEAMRDDLDYRLTIAG